MPGFSECQAVRLALAPIIAVTAQHVQYKTAINAEVIPGGPTIVLAPTLPTLGITFVITVTFAVVLPTIGITLVIALAFAITWICIGKATGHGQRKGQRNRHELRTL